MQGYVKLYRQVLDHLVWQDPHYLKLWMYCLIKATHKERDVLLGNQVVTLKAGQFITGRKTLWRDLNQGMKPKQKLSEKTWYRYLENLEKWEMLTINKSPQNSIISVLKWQEYQEMDRQLTSHWPSSDPRLSTNKHVKHVKHVKNFCSSKGDADFSECLRFYQANLQKGLTESPFNIELLNIFFHEHGKDILMAAMKRSAKAEVKGIHFLEGVLNNWREAGVKTLEDVQKYHMAFKEHKRLRHEQKRGAINEPNDDVFAPGEGDVLLFQH